MKHEIILHAVIRYANLEFHKDIKLPFLPNKTDEFTILNHFVCVRIFNISHDIHRDDVTTNIYCILNEPDKVSKYAKDELSHDGWTSNKRYN